MRIQVLGCHGAEAPNQRTCAFLINDSMLLDAGTVCSALSFARQRRIRTILISHIHLDHIKSLPFLAESAIAGADRRPIVIAAVPEVLAGLKRHLFNNRVWPDHTVLPNRSRPFFRLKPLSEGKAAKLGDFYVTAIKVRHTVPCAGFLIRHKKASILYGSDTSSTTEIWEAAARDRYLKAAMIEASFPNRMEALAAGTGHLTPSAMAGEFEKIGKPRLPLYVYHVKPSHARTVRREIGRLKMKNLKLLEDGMVFRV